MKRKSTGQLAQSRMRCRDSSRHFMRIPDAVKQKLQRCFVYLSESTGQLGNWKEGHFTVLTIGNNEQRKFFVALNYLRYPPFLKLLEAAEQEFGFDQPGVLVIPCEASELQRILSLKSERTYC